MEGKMPGVRTANEYPLRAVHPCFHGVKRTSRLSLRLQWYDWPTFCFTSKSEAVVTRET